jgi:hypothetical protein
MAAPKLIGSQVPRIESVPPWVTSSGADAIELAALTGMPMDPAQKRILWGALGHTEDGDWSAPEVGLVVPRQNLKTVTMQVAALHAVFLMKSRVIYTSHIMTTTQKIHEETIRMIENAPDLDREVKKVKASTNDYSITLRSGARIDFVARTATSARGWSGYDVILMDEAFALAATQTGALMPILFARQNWQIWYISSAGQKDSDALRRIRNRGIAKDPGLAYYEWSVPSEVYQAAPEYVANMPAALAQSNPALGIRIKLKTLQIAQRSMPEDQFAREVLGVWEDPLGAPIIDLNLWALLADPLSSISSQMVFSIEVDEDLSYGCILVSGYRSDGIPHVEVTSRDGVLDHRPGVTWLIERAVELNEQWSPAAWVLDPAGPAGALLENLRAAGIEPELVGVRELGQACGALHKATTAIDELRHLNQLCVAEAIRIAQKRDIGDGLWSFSRRRSEDSVSPVLGIALALHGLAVYGARAYDVLESMC